MLKYLIAGISFINADDERTSQVIVNMFLNSGLKLVDMIYLDEMKRGNFTLLGEKEALISAIKKGFKKISSFSKKNNEQLRISLISFFPLRHENMDEAKVFVLENLKDLSDVYQKGIIPIGYLATQNNPPFINYYTQMEPEIYQKQIISKKRYLQIGQDFVQSEKNILYVGVKPYSIVIYLKVMIENPAVIDEVCEKLIQFGRINYEYGDNQNIKEGPSFLKIAHTYSVLKDTVTIAIKVNDYIKMPVHKILIYIYDLLEKNGCIPYDAEFATPIPLEVIKLAGEDLFSDIKSPEDLSREIREVLSMFRFNIESIFEYPSMIIEKRLNLSDILIR